MGRPKGIFGVKWDDDVTAAAARLGVNCTRADAWEGNEGFETFHDPEHTVNAFGEAALVRLFFRENKVKGLQLSFQNCQRWDDLRDKVRREFDLSSESETDIYDSWSSGELIRLVREGGSCVLTIAGAEFGKAYAAQTLADGMGRLASGLQP